MEESKVDESREKTGGRTKGTPNKHTVAIKEAFDFAFDGLGGAEGLLAWASYCEQKKDKDGNLLSEKYPNLGEFYKMYAKQLPRYQDITSDGQQITIGSVSYKPTERND